MEDRIRIICNLEDQLVEQAAEPVLPAAQRQLIDERLDRLAANPDKYLSWDELKRRARSGG